MAVDELKRQVSAEKELKPKTPTEKAEKKKKFDLFASGSESEDDPHDNEM